MNWLTKILKKEKEVEKKEENFSKDVVVKEKSPKVDKVDIESKNARGKLMTDVFWAHHLTEKASLGKEKDKYVFKVSPGANKFMVSRAVEEHFEVEVKSVNIVNTRGKEIRRGKQIGRRPGLKKAVVTLKKGQNIDVQ